MAVSITIDDLDGDVLERLRAEARRRGVDVGMVIKELLDKGLPRMTEETSQPPYHDLDRLAGTWSQEKAEAFLAVIADFEQVDEDLWT